MSQTETKTNLPNEFLMLGVQDKKGKNVKVKPNAKKVRRRSFDDDPVADEQEAGNMMELLQKMLNEQPKMQGKSEREDSIQNEEVKSSWVNHQQDPGSPPSNFQKDVNQKPIHESVIESNRIVQETIVESLGLMDNPYMLDDAKAKLNEAL